MKTKQLHKLNRKTEEEIFLRRRLEELTKEMRQNRHIFMQQAAKEATEKTTAVSIAGKNKETSQKEEQKQQKICTPEKNKAQKPAADSRDVYKELERLRKENDKLQKMAQKFMTGKPSSTVAVSAPSSTAAAAPTLTKPVSVAAVQNYVSAELDQVVPVPKAVKSKKQLSTEKAENLIQKQSSAEMMARPSADKGQQTTTRITEYHQAQSNPRHEIPTGEDVPVRDTSNSIPQGSDKLKRIVSEIFARHQSDLVYIKNSNLGIELPQPQQLLQNFSSGQQPTQQLRSSMTEQPKNVNRTNIRAKASHGLTDSEEEAAAPPRLINVNSPDPDPFNFIATVKRKMPNFDSGTKEVEKGKNSGKKRQPAAVKQGDKDGSDLTISEGPLSTSFASSAAAAAAAAGANDALAKKLKKAKKKKKEKQQRKSFVPSPLPPEPNINDVNVGASTSKGLAAETSQQPMVTFWKLWKEICDIHKINCFLVSFQVRPEALRLRFMAEMQQMDTIQQVESHIRQIKQIKDVHTAKHEASDMARYIQVNLLLNFQRNISCFQFFSILFYTTYRLLKLLWQKLNWRRNPKLDRSSRQE